MGDAHGRVVDRGGEGVERVAVGAAQREVRDVLRLEGHVAPHQVVPGDGALGHAEPHDRRATLGLERGPLLGGELAAEAVVPLHLGAGGLATRVHLLVGAEAVVGVRRMGQLGQHVAVELGALGLAVGTVVAADLDALVPRETEPLHQSMIDR